MLIELLAWVGKRGQRAFRLFSSSSEKRVNTTTGAELMLESPSQVLIRMLTHGIA